MPIKNETDIQGRIDALAAKQEKGEATLIVAYDVTKITTDILILVGVSRHQMTQQTLTEFDVQDLLDKDLMNKNQAEIVGRMFEHVDRNWKEGHSRITGLSEKQLANLYLTGELSIFDFANLNMLRLFRMMLDM